MDVDNKLLMDAVAAINARFKSANSVPVDRAWVTEAEWRNLQFAMSVSLPESSDQNLLELAATFETCIPFLPSAGQRNIGKAVAQLRHMAMGFVLVPVEPTEAMLNSGLFGLEPMLHASDIRVIYDDMLSARPEVKP